MARFLALALILAPAAAYNCTTDTDCTDTHNAWGPTPTCVVDASGWSQCISCTYDPYQSACASWDAEVRTAAALQCSITCLTPLSCVSDANCTIAPDDKCSDTGFCLSCDETQYQVECAGWNDDEKASGKSTCDLKCGDKCQSDDDCVDMPDSRSTCVVQDASWSSCIDCNTFAADCAAWTKDFRAAAETVCGATCEASDDDDAAADCAADFTQCGGKAWAGATECCSTSGTMTCQIQNDQYSQCLPEAFAKARATA